MHRLCLGMIHCVRVPTDPGTEPATSVLGLEDVTELIFLYLSGF